MLMFKSQVWNIKHALKKMTGVQNYAEFNM